MDGYVYAQPLVLTNVTMGNGTYNVVYVATEHDSLYAIDATNGNVLWQASFINPASGITTVSKTDVNCTDLVPEIGITGTPVIDPSTSTIYLVARTKENGTFVQRLHALDAATHAEKFGGPVVISASVTGTGAGSTGSMVAFDPLRENQRPGLLLQNGHVIIGWASHCDNTPYHGWVMSYNAGTLAQEAVLNVDPNGSDAGVWMSGAAPAGDSNFNTYLSTGNGTYDGTPDFGDSILKLSLPTSGTFPVADWFTPYNQASLSSNDSDVGAGGVLLLPDLPAGATNPHLLVVVSKGGTLFLVNRDAMGQLCSTCTNGDTQIVQEIPGFVSANWGTPAYWNGSLYVGGATESGSGNALKAFSFNANNSGLVSTTPTSQTAQMFPFPGPTPSVSADGTSNGIVWALENASFSSSCCQVLHAYDATNLASELYNTNQAAHQVDVPGGAVKFSVPTVANGRVYVGSQSSLSIYGLFASKNPPPTFSPTPEVYPSMVSVTLADSAPGTAIYYTTDGSTPTTSSTVYTAPITVNTTTTIKAMAAGGTLSQSAGASATYTIQAQATPPTFSPPPGTFQSSTSVTLADNSAGVTIYYTTDGSTPTTASTVYAGPISLSATTMINAMAAGSGFTASTIASGAFVDVTPVIDFGGGFTGTGMSLNGSASYSATRLRLTDGGTYEASSAFSTTPVNVQTFTTDFSFQLTSPNADGMTFTIQNSGPTALGTDGGGLGFGPDPNTHSGTGIPNSVAVKFDLYSNAGEGNDSTGLYTNGVAPTTPGLDMTNSGVNLHSGDVFDVHITYDGATLTMTIMDATNNADTFTASWPIDIPATVGGNTAYMGFTGGTGGLTATQDILSWSVFLGGVTLVPSAGLGFPTQGVGTPGTSLPITVSNAGTTPVTFSSYSISGGNAGDFNLQNNGCPNSSGTLAVAASCSITVSFTPAASGPRKSTLTIVSNTAGSPNSISLTGVGSALSLSPASLNFSSQSTGTSSAPQAITLSNVGGTLLNIWETALTGPNASDFSATTTCGTTLAPAAQCTVNVTFSPSATGPRTATWMVSDDGGGSPQSVSLTGPGATPAAPAKTSGNVGSGDGSPQAVPVFSPSSISFGKQKVGSTGRAQTVVLTNGGSTPINTGNIVISGQNPGDFAQANTCGGALGAGRTCYLRVLFTPHGDGLRRATIAMVSAVQGGSHLVEIQGTGVRIASGRGAFPAKPKPPAKGRDE